MAARLIDGKKIASDIKKNLKKETSELKIKGISPCLAVIFNGAAPLSKKYVALKKKASKEIGVNIFLYNIRELTTQKELIRLVDRLNATPKINGILLQFPLAGIKEKEVINRIAPEKDIDGCSPSTLNKLGLDEPYFIPCTSYGVIKMLEAYGINLEGKHAVIVENCQMGNNGKFLSFLLSKKSATVTCFSKKTPNLKEECLKADILCIAVGKAKMITADMIKKGAIVIDLGMNVTLNGKIIGDVDFDAAKKKAAYITPVPGGIGPVTIAMILHNTLLAVKMQNRLM